jgi:hypothetical protein
MPWWGWLIAIGLVVMAATAVVVVSIIVKGQKSIFDKFDDKFMGGGRKDWGR